MKISAKFKNILSRAFRATLKEKSLVLASWRKDASGNVPTELHSCYSGACYLDFLNCWEEKLLKWKEKDRNAGQVLRRAMKASTMSKGTTVQTKN